MVTMPPNKTPKSTATLVLEPAARTFDPTNPFIVQCDRSVLVEVDNPKYAEARDALAPFAELEKSPEHIHTYRISNLSLWNAAAAGFTAEQMVEVLQQYTKFPLPPNLPADIAETVVALRPRPARAASTSSRSSWSAPTSRCWRNCRRQKKLQGVPRREARRRRASRSTRPTAAC